MICHSFLYKAKKASTETDGKNIDKKSYLSYISVSSLEKYQVVPTDPSERRILRVRREPSRVSAQDIFLCFGRYPKLFAISKWRKLWNPTAKNVSEIEYAF